MSKTLLPEAVRFHWPDSMFEFFRVGPWAIVAVLLALVARWSQHRPWDQGSLRLAIAIAPLIPAYLHTRRLRQWWLELDEMQRRIQMDTLRFAAMWTLFVRMAWDVLQNAGFFPAGWLSVRLGVEGTFALMFALYLLGWVAVNRRYE